MTGDFRQSVSYAALGYFPYSALELGIEEQQALLESARGTLEHYLKTGERKPIPARGELAALDRRTSAFVTLHSHGELRGCVGNRTSNQPLSQMVPALTLCAALDDRRFAPVRPGETDLELEISVLSPMKRVLNLEQFRVNEHGALLEADDYRGLLLPQVATERNWNAAQFFEALARKAGARRDVYQEPSTRVYVFRAQIIR
jgi:AmmeMemoRadiSam system protein A